MLTDPRFSPPIANLGLPIVTTEAFLGLTHQVQALAGMVQTNWTKFRRKSLNPRKSLEKAQKVAPRSPPRYKISPLPTNFRLPSLELYDDSCDPTEHVTTFPTVDAASPRILLNLQSSALAATRPFGSQSLSVAVVE
ncbi:hypothetical protein BHM03_00020295 [Ensete ventricosum]|nr:hypothetical protein BHM03_00020295 [Ensete ventricosum]